MKPKILIFTLAHYPFWSGGEMAAQEIANRLPEIEFDLVTKNFTHSPPHERFGNINIYRINSPKLLFPFLAYFKARSLHKKNNYNIIWSIMANRAGFAALFFKFNYPKIKFLLTLQEGDPFSYIKKRSGIIWPVIKPLFKKIFTKADYIQAISQYLADWAKNMKATCPIEIIPNGVDLKNFCQEIPESKIKELKVKLGKKQNNVFLIHTGRSVEKNALNDIIKALLNLPEEIKLLLIGNGPDDAALKKLALDLNLTNRVLFLDFIKHQDLLKYLKISDIFVRPSLSEGLGSSFLEAMAAGLPIIGTAVGGIPDFLIHGETGLFAKIKSPQSIAEQIKLLLKDENLKNKLINNGQKLVLKKYDWNVIAQKMQTVFSKI